VNKNINRPLRRKWGWIVTPSQEVGWIVTPSQEVGVDSYLFTRGELEEEVAESRRSYTHQFFTFFSSQNLQTHIL